MLHKISVNALLNTQGHVHLKQTPHTAFVYILYLHFAHNV